MSDLLPILAQQVPEPEPAPRQGTGAARAQPADGRPAAEGAGDAARKDAAREHRPFDLFHPPTRIFDTEIHHAPIVAIPVFLLILATVSIVVERVAAAFVRRLASRTQTRVDDVFAAGLPSVVRLALSFVALRVVVGALDLTDEASARWGAVVAALGVLVTGIALARLVLRMSDAWADDRPNRKPLAPGIKLGIKIAAIPIVGLMALHAAGLSYEKIAPLITVLGVGSLAVALALQDVLKNIFSGVQLVVDQPIRAGDFIAVDDGKVRGTVIEIGLRSTKLRTVENNIVILPNSSVANAIVTNMDVLDRTYAHTLRIGVAYGTDTRRVQEVLQEEADAAIAASEVFAKKPAKVLFVDFGDSALLFHVGVTLRGFSERTDAISELNHRVHDRLRREGIEIPYPTRTIHLRSETPPPGAPPEAPPARA